MTFAVASIQNIVQSTVDACVGVELVEIERLSGGLLSITIDESNNPLGVSIANCEQITRQLQAVFFVENIDYERLEVGSPGVNRLLFKHEHFVRFAGERVTVKLKEPFQNRKNYTGILLAQKVTVKQDGSHFVNHTYDLAIEPKALSKTQQKKIAKSLGLDNPAPEIELSFRLDEIEFARLDPLLDFKGKQP